MPMTRKKNTHGLKIAAFANEEQMARLKHDLKSKRFYANAAVQNFTHQTLSAKNAIDLRAKIKRENKMRLSGCLLLNDKYEHRRSSTVRSAPTNLMNCRFEAECVSEGSRNESGITNKVNSSSPRLTLKNWAERQQITTQIKDTFASALNKSKSSLSGFSLKSYDSEHKEKKNKASFQHCSSSSTTLSLKSSTLLTDVINCTSID